MPLASVTNLSFWHHDYFVNVITMKFPLNFIQISSKGLNTPRDLLDSLQLKSPKGRYH